MKLAYCCHHYTLIRIQNAKTEEEQMRLALNYFLHDGPIVDEEMKKKLEEDEQRGQAATNGHS